MAATSASRRRQRSTRLVVAVVLLGLAGLLVAAAVISGSLVLAMLSAVASLALGAAATKITHSELLQTRRDWASDRAEQARVYRSMDERRTADHRAYVGSLQRDLDERRTAVIELEDALVLAQRRAADAGRKFNAEAGRADRAEDEVARLRREVELADERAAEAIVQLAELEQDVDVLRSELEAWQQVPLRRHA